MRTASFRMIGDAEAHSLREERFGTIDRFPCDGHSLSHSCAEGTTGTVYVVYCLRNCSSMKIDTQFPAFLQRTVRTEWREHAQQ